MESSLGRLQRLVDKQEKQILDLKERLQKEKEKNKSNELMLDYYKDNIQKMVAKAVEKQIAPILE